MTINQPFGEIIAEFCYTITVCNALQICRKINKESVKAEWKKKIKKNKKLMQCSSTNYHKNKDHTKQFSSSLLITSLIYV